MASSAMILFVDSTLTPSKLIIVGLLGLWLPAVASSALQSALQKEQVMVFRRSFTATCVLLCFIAASTLLGLILKLLGLPLTGGEMSVIGVAFASSFNALIYRYMTGRKVLNVVLTSSLWPVLAVLSLVLLGVLDVASTAPMVVASFALMGLAAYAISRAIDKLGEKLVGISAKRVFRAYVINWFTGAKEGLEQVFNHVGVDSEVSCDLAIALGPDGSVKGVIAVPQVHPGPLKNIGSSNLPPDMVKLLESATGSKALVLHGFVTHASDITSSRDYEKFLSEVATSLKSMWSSGRLRAASSISSPLVRVEAAGLSIGCQLIGGRPWVFLSGGDSGIEDVPEHFKARVERSISSKFGLKPILINAHNSYQDEVKLDLDEVEKGVLEAVDLALKASLNEPVKVGLSRVELGEYSEAHGIGSAGVGVLVLERGGLKYCYVVVDANNSDRSFRERLRSEVVSMGFEDCELFTTDNHSLVHVRGVTAERGYYILGERIDVEHFLSIVKRAVEEACSKLCEAEVLYLTVKVRAHVLGETGHRNIEALMNESVKTFKKLSLSLYVPALLVLYALSLLL
ncbi:MAG: hypothetical protein DRJ68_03845 [Thermoprotei archaeon]|nr:MAG: hypothetical protein DRJ68_03845 [Thermoprotei archaeon]